MSAVDWLVQGMLTSTHDGSILLGIASWHINPGMLFLGHLHTDVCQRDPIVSPGGVLTVGLKVNPKAGLVSAGRCHSPTSATTAALWCQNAHCQHKPTDSQLTSSYSSALVPSLSLGPYRQPRLHIVLGCCGRVLRGPPRTSALQGRRTGLNSTPERVPHCSALIVSRRKPPFS